MTPLPKKTEAGNPDFRIWDGKEKIVGYIEAKDPKIENLDSVEEIYHILNDKRIAFNLNTVEDYRLLGTS